MKILGEHQANFLPYLGVWEKLLVSDIFVWADDVQYVRRDWQHRVQITSPRGPGWLTLSNNGSITSMIYDVSLVKNYSKDIKNKLNGWYGKTVWGKKIIDFLHDGWVEKPMIYLNLELIELLLDAKIFGDIDYPVIGISSELALKNDIKTVKTDRIIDDVKYLECDAYFTGIGGKGYLDIELFNKNNIKLIWQKFEPFVYKQMYSKQFIFGMSILDALVNEVDLVPFGNRVMLLKEKIKSEAKKDIAYSVGG